MNKIRAIFAVLVIGVLVSCGGVALKTDYQSYAGSYGEMVNHQILLNLARTSNGHPPHFLAIGEIDSDHTINATIGGGGGQDDSDVSRNSLAGMGVLSRLARTGTRSLALDRTRTDRYNGTANVTRGVAPKFQFIPMNDEQLTKQLLDPIPQEIFYTLYRQGIPMDLLLRVLVERIEIHSDDYESEVFTNSPAPGIEYEYGQFLRLAEMLRIYQKRGALLVEDIDVTNKAFEGSFDKFTPEDLARPGLEGMYWKQEENGWSAIKHDKKPALELNNRKFHAKAALQKLYNAESKTAFHDDFVNVVEDWIVYLQAGNNMTERSRVILRSYGRVLEAVGQEQEMFEDFLARYRHAIKPDGTGDPVSDIPRRQQRPIIDTRFDFSDATSPITVSLKYAGKRHAVADLKSYVDPESKTWNRDVFRLVAQLSSVVTTDISKFNRGVLEVR